MYPTKTQHLPKPSFSSTLLDQIYRSIDHTSDIKFHAQAMSNKHDRVLLKQNEPDRVGARSQRRQCKTQTEELMFFSSTSSSSDSSSGLLSSSDTESLYGTRSKSRVSCFAPSRPIPKHSSASNEEDGLIKSKSRALKIYNNLKKVKQPISPGGRLSNFINSLFATGNVSKKTKASKSEQDSTASSFSRSCLSKATTTPSSSNTNRDSDPDPYRVKRTVRFYPVSVILDEDSRPCGHKSLVYEDDTRLMPWSIGRHNKNQLEQEFKVMDKNRRVEEATREFLKEYHRSHLIHFRDIVDDDDDDDAASYASSDLFELDHLAVVGDNNRYHQDLPVYETTHLSTNRAIANGLI